MQPQPSVPTHFGAFLQLNNIRNAYDNVLARVNVALRAFVGDEPRLAEVRTLAMSLYAASQQVRLLVL